MPKSERQKLKLLMLADIFLRETDDAHGLTLSEIQAKLAAQGVAAERKCLYNDFAALEDYGLDLVRSRDKVMRYALAHRTFELPELKLLVDAVQSCKFLSERKSRALIGKLESLASHYEARELQRQVYVAHRVKSMNESVYYSIDTLHAAIAQDRQITFRYFVWTVDKTQQFRHEGKVYRVSPYALIWDDEMYYLVAYDDAAGGIRHYRVDKMQGIEIAPQKRAGQCVFAGMDMAVYSQTMFGMFGGEAVDVELLFTNRLAG
ncbi:MAG: WYL domain-containing protein, partial [Ruthenibacterium sp.]